MSTRQLLNLALGAVALLFVASGSLVWNQSHNGQFTDQQIGLAQKQQIIIQDLGRGVDDLQKADDQESVAFARRRVGQTILNFDQNLSALDKGGLLVTSDTKEAYVPKIKGGQAREALDEAIKTWRNTGTPLANLAAGEFSIYSAAGQDAVHGLNDNTVMLMEQMGTIANALRAGDVARKALARLATWGTGIFGMVFIVLAWLRIRFKTQETSETQAEAQGQQPAPRQKAANLAASLTPPETAAQHPSRPLTPGGEYSAPQGRKETPLSGTIFTSPVDFDSVNATVDQMTVDMNTIASSTDKMQLAIDSVGHAFQGMLYSLKEMAQDTAEGYKIVRGANNAASFTAQAAEDLVASAKEMSQVVSRVTQLALRTRQVASQIDAEAIGTGQTGEAFTSVVATEVKGLAQQTSSATMQIETTVSEILATARQYDEAIGQIIKNISAINKVSQNLGELMLTPPTHVVPGVPVPTPLTPPPAVVSTPQPPVAPAVPEPPAEALDPFISDPVPEPVGQDEPQVAAPEPAPATETEAAVQPEPEPEPQAPAPEPAKPSFSLDDDDPEPPMPSLEDVAQETSDVIEELGLDDPVENMETVTESAPTPQAKPEAEASDPEPTPDEPVEQPVAEKTAEKADEPTDKQTDEQAETSQSPGGSNGNVFMLNKPKKPLQMKVDEDPAPDATIEETIEPEKSTTPNIYNLKMPDPGAEPEDDIEPDEDALIGGQEIEPEETPAANSTGGAATATATTKAKPTVFMLNKPKKKS